VVELTVRMSTRNDQLVHFLLCDMLRSAIQFWNPRFGPVVFVLDEGDQQSKHGLPDGLRGIEGFPFEVLTRYMPLPERSAVWMDLAKQSGRDVGYVDQLYTSYFLDYEVNDSLIAWIDTDVIMTSLVTSRNIFASDGKINVQGLNTFGSIKHVKDWDDNTRVSIGFPMVADFMTYFPVYLRPDTIKNCRDHITKRRNKTNFKEAFIDIAMEKNSKWPSPVNVILSYAWYYERDKYSWHIDINYRDSNYDLKTFNSMRFGELPIQHHLTEKDTEPLLNTAIHSKYHRTSHHVHKSSMCFVQNITGQVPSEWCKDIKTHEPNLHLLEFDSNLDVNHVGTWWKHRRAECLALLDQQKTDIIEFARAGNYRIDLHTMCRFEEFAKKLDVLGKGDGCASLMNCSSLPPESMSDL